MFKEELKTLLHLYRKGLYSKPYYSRRIQGEEAFSSYESFCRIPLMDKQSIRESSCFERTNTPMEDVFGIFSSSGTTGKKTFYVYSKKDKEVHEEFVRHFFSELGITEKDLGGIMAPVGTGVMAHTMLWEFSTVGAGYINCPEPSPENMMEIVENTPVTVIATRPNTASAIAYFPDLVQKARKSSVKKLTLGGGFLSAERRKLIEGSWGAECYNLFGMSEMFGPMAAECRMRNGLHYLNQYLMIELLDPVTKEPVSAGSPGVAVYTTLWEKGFPLLRYWTDDMMIISREPCSCGSPLPRLFYLGRMADHYKNSQGYVFPEQVENILFAAGLTGEYRVSCRKNDITVYTEASPCDTEAVRKSLCNLFGVEVSVKTVPAGSLHYRGFGNRFDVRS